MIDIDWGAIGAVGELLGAFGIMTREATLDTSSIVYTGGIDGIAGPGTVAAITRYAQAVQEAG